jgi:hypothetical protein
MTVVCPDTESTGSQVAEMSANDLILVVPWIIFAAGLAIISIRLHGRRRRRDHAREAECRETERHTRR